MQSPNFKNPEVRSCFAMGSSVQVTKCDRFRKNCLQNEARSKFLATAIKLPSVVTRDDVFCTVT